MGIVQLKGIARLAEIRFSSLLGIGPGTESGDVLELGSEVLAEEVADGAHK